MSRVTSIWQDRRPRSRPLRKASSQCSGSSAPFSISTAQAEQWPCPSQLTCSVSHPCGDRPCSRSTARSVRPCCTLNSCHSRPSCTATVCVVPGAPRSVESHPARLSVAVAFGGVSFSEGGVMGMDRRSIRPLMQIRHRRTPAVVSPNRRAFTSPLHGRLRRNRVHTTAIHPPFSTIGFDAEWLSPSSDVYRGRPSQARRRPDRFRWYGVASRERRCRPTYSTSRDIRTRRGAHPVTRASATSPSSTGPTPSGVPV